jgi:hypothetical protein
MNLLVSIADFTDLGILFPVNTSIDLMKRYIIEAQDFDIKPVLGELLYYDILANSDDDKYVDLLAGDIDYTYLNHNYTYTGGLKDAICSYAYARYLPYANKKNTEFGIVMKRNENSDHVSTKDIQLQMNDAKSAGFGYLENVKTYLTRKNQITPGTYPLWRFGGTPPLFGIDGCNDKGSGMRFTKVGNI